METIPSSQDVANILADYCDDFFQYLWTLIDDATKGQSLRCTHSWDFEAVIRGKVMTMLTSIQTFDVPRENWQNMIMQLSARIDTLQPPVHLRCQEYVRKLREAIQYLITQEYIHFDAENGAASLWRRAIAAAASVIRDENTSALRVN